LAMALCISVPASALYIVDIGDTDSEIPYNLTDWSDPWPNATGGSWGGGSSDGTWRTIATNTTTDSAYIDLDFGPFGAMMNVNFLEGQAEDSFKIWAGTSELFHFDASEYGTQEQWLETGSFYVDLIGEHTIRFESTGPPWSGYDTWGQVAISSITVDPIPEPGTILLLGVGLLGLAGFGRKKFFKK